MSPGAIAGVVISVIVVSVLLYQLYIWRLETKNTRRPNFSTIGHPPPGGRRNQLLYQTAQEDDFDEEGY
jgi:hypothetical protein